MKITDQNNNNSVSTQFGAGQRINKHGRPKGSPNVRTIVQNFANKQHVMAVNGERRQISTVLALLHIIQKHALNGSVKHAEFLDKIQSQYSPEQVGEDGTKVLVVCETMPMEIWQILADKLNEHRHEPPKLTNKEWLEANLLKS